MIQKYNTPGPLVHRNHPNNLFRPSERIIEIIP